MAKQRALFAEIIQVKWNTFRSEALTRSQLETAGFSDLEFIYDSQGMFPTVVAKKQHREISTMKATQ